MSRDFLLIEDGYGRPRSAPHCALTSPRDTVVSTRSGRVHMSPALTNTMQVY